MAKKLEFKDMTKEELIENYVNFKSNLFGLRFQHSVGQLSDTNQIEKTKRNIARVLTEMNNRGIDAASIKMPVVKKDKKVKNKKNKAKKQEKKPETKKEAKKEEKKAETKPAPAPKLAAEMATKTAPKKPAAKTTTTKTTAAKKVAPKTEKEGK